MLIYTIFVVYLGQIFRCKTVFIQQLVPKRLIGSYSIIFNVCICGHLFYGRYFFLFMIDECDDFFIINCMVPLDLIFVN